MSVTPTQPSNGIELQREQREILIRCAAALAVCASALASAHYLLPPLSWLSGSTLELRLKFLAGANLFLVLWVVLAFGAVSHGRRHSPEDISGSAYSAPSPKIAVAVAFLQNTLEQYVVAFASYFSLLMIAGEKAMPFIACAVLLFAIGRICFYLGYSKGAGGRAFGMAVTALPSLAALAIAGVAALT